MAAEQSPLAAETLAGLLQKKLAGRRTDNLMTRGYSLGVLSLPPGRDGVGHYRAWATTDGGVR